MRAYFPSLLAAAALLAAGAPQLAWAAEDDDFLIATASDLATLCSVPPEHPRHGAAVHMCHGYMIGAHHLHQAAIAPTETGGFYCVPEDSRPSRDAVVAEFVAWTAETPGAGDLPAIEGLIRWANVTYPCS